MKFTREFFLPYSEEPYWLIETGKQTFVVNKIKINYKCRLIQIQNGYELAEGFSFDNLKVDSSSVEISIVEGEQRELVLPVNDEIFSKIQRKVVKL